MEGLRVALGGLFALILLGTSIDTSQAQIDMHVEDAATIGYVGAQSSIAIARNGTPHISHVRLYEDPALVYTTKIDGVWVTEVVDTTVGLQSFRDTTLRLDALGRPHISYYESYDSDLRYASRIDGEWVIEFVDSVGSVGLQAQMVLDRIGNPHIAYVDLFEVDLRYATKANGQWKIEVVDSEGIVGTYPSIALDSAGNPHISYYDVSTLLLKYAKRLFGGWHTEYVSTQVDISGCTALGIDRRGAAKIAFRSYDGDLLTYAERADEGWKIEQVDTGGDAIRDTQMAVGRDGVPHITFRSETTDGVKYVTKVHNALEDSWLVVDVNAPGEEAMGISVALDPQLRVDPRFAYLDVADGDLKYVEASMVAASVDPGAGSAPVEIEAFPNPAPGGRVEIAYSIPELGAEDLRIEVVDVRGRRVRSMEAVAGGGTRLAWDGTDASARPVPAGVYFLRLLDGSRPLATESITVLR